MNYRNGTYSAFYVSEPFNQNNLGAYAAKDFAFYQLVQAWKAQDPSFPFIDSHAKTYNVRDGSDFEKTLKPRLHKRLLNSKNVLLFLSERTKPSLALDEEMDCGIGYLELPVIVVYPDIMPVDATGITWEAEDLWGLLPSFKRHMGLVPTLHIPLAKDMIRVALRDPDLMVQTAIAPGVYYPRLHR